LAAGENHLKVVELLLKPGASATAADRWGHTPVDDALAPRKPGLLDVPLSADEDNEAIIAVLKAAGGAAKTTAASSRAEATAKAMDMSSSKGGKAAAAARQAAADAGLFVDLKEVELEVRLGGGSFGDVYKAKWKQTPVAAKCLRATGPERRQALADFHVEAGILRHLRHPNICLLLAYSTEPGKEVMVSELMRCSLLDVLRTANLHDRPIGKRRGLRYLQELARGMHYLHTQDPPVLHRDLKVCLKAGGEAILEQPHALTCMCSSFLFLSHSRYKRFEPARQLVDRRGGFDSSGRFWVSYSAAPGRGGGEHFPQKHGGGIECFYARCLC
jgi:hypothetical protein